MIETPYMKGLYLSPEGKQKLYKIAQAMAEKAWDAVREMPDKEREEFFDYCDKQLQSGAATLKYTLESVFIPAALGLQVYCPQIAS